MQQISNTRPQDVPPSGQVIVDQNGREFVDGVPQAAARTTGQLQHLTVREQKAQIDFDSFEGGLVLWGAIFLGIGGVYPLAMVVKLFLTGPDGDYGHSHARQHLTHLKHLGLTVAALGLLMLSAGLTIHGWKTK